ncbi:MAG: putative ABC transporter permease [Bacillota bacterium]|nr:putative ABC transporter permease [Bacillota bacterium]MDW7677053.1 putative ABC transporter permease [Bacillota bacterium]
MLNQVAWMFMMYGLMGWLWETSFVSLREGRFINRGFLRGPLIPLYGFASITLLLTMDWLSKRLVLNTVFYSLAAVLCAAVVASLWEYGISYLMEKAFKTRWWDYSHLRFNLNGRIALLPSTFWGVGGFVLWQYVNPALARGYERLELQEYRWVLFVLYAVLSVDAAVTLSELIQYRQVLTRLHNVSEGIFDVMASRLERIEESFDQREALMKMLREAREELRLKASYIRLERMSDFGEFTGYIHSTAKSILEGHENRLEEFTEILSRIRKHKRFYKSFPNAVTRKLPYIHFVIRQKKKS